MMGMDVEKNRGRISVCDSVLTNYLLLSQNTGVQKIYKGDFFLFYLFFVCVCDKYIPFYCHYTFFPNVLQ